MWGRLTAVIGVACLTVGAPDARARKLADVSRPVEIRAWNGLQIWDGEDAQGDAGLVLRRNGVARVVPRVDATDADVGPGPGGKGHIVYVDERRLAVARLDGTRVATVPGTTGAREPTIWGSRVAWVRGDATVMTSRLDGSGARRLNGLPAGAFVRELELQRTSLALAGGTDDDLDASELVRIVDVRSGRRTKVADFTVGQAGQTVIGLSWARGRLFYYETCAVDSSGCAGAFRYDPARRRHARAFSRRRLGGFAIDADGRHAFISPSHAIDPVDEEESTVERVALRFR